MIVQKINIIRGFTPVAKPHFGGEEHAMRYIIWNLYNRVCESIKSFTVLLDNKQYYDAFIIAGHMLETCSVLSYIKDNNTEEECRKKYDKYIARSAVGRLHAMLDMDEDLKKDKSWNAYAMLLKILYPVGMSIMQGKNAAIKYEECIKKINFRGGTNLEKIKLLKKYFESPRIGEYITAFSENIGNIDDGQFAQYYTKYCNYKHSNMMTPGATAGDISFEEVDWFLTLVLGIIMYLNKSNLEQYRV